MKDAQKPDHVSLNTLIGRLKEGRYVIPDFQREFEWGAADIRDLMRSIFLDYYIGSLLLWKGREENFQALSCEPVYGHSDGGSREHIVLDGQQRLTAMYYAFLAPNVPLPNRTNRCFFFVRVDKFMAEEYDQAFEYVWLSQRWSKLLADRQSQFAEHIFPLSVMGAGGWDLPNWVQDYEKHWQQKATETKAIHEEKGKIENGQPESDAPESPDSHGEVVDNKGIGQGANAFQHVQNAREFGQHIKDLTEQYQISYIELDKDLAVDKVCDIFTQINSRGVRLDVFDLVNALLKPKGLQLKKMWREAASRLEFVDTEKMNVYILQVMSILRQSYCSPKYLYFLLPGQEKSVRDADGTRRKEVLIADIAEFEKRWQQAVTALEAAIVMLRHPHEFGVTSSQYLPYVSILPVFAAVQTHAKFLPSTQQLSAQRKIHHWYWASVFNNRYSGSVESTSARDFLDLKAWMANDDAEPTFVLEFAHRFRDLELRKEVKKGTSVYNGVFNLLILQGPRDWVAGTIPQPGELDDHHIVPASWGNKNLNSNLVHSILNRTPLTEGTNRKVIRDRLPNAYLPELIQTNGEKQVREVLESHFISPTAFDILLRNPFGPDDFEAFITERQRTLKDAIENLLIKERLDLPPQLREMDAQIERIELALRELVDTELGGDASLVPSHFMPKVNDRISGAVKKNPALDLNLYQSLAGKLEFFDLREVQETIVSKALWSRFEDRFKSKEVLAKQFNQLADLRNSIRHSRAVDAITHKEGEAAILWFSQVLNK